MAQCSLLSVPNAHLRITLLSWTIAGNCARFGMISADRMTRMH